MKSVSRFPRVPVLRTPNQLLLVSTRQISSGRSFNACLTSTATSMHTSTLVEPAGSFVRVSMTSHRRSFIRSSLIQTSKRSHTTTTSDSNQMSIISPPVCVEKPHTLSYHGDTRVDPFYWLRERENPEVKAFLEKENEYTKSVIAGQGAPELEKKLFEEMKGRWKETDTSLPNKDKNYWYYSRTIEGLNYKVYTRRPHSKNENFCKDFVQALAADENAVIPKSEDEQLIIDLNEFAKEEELEFVDLGDYSVAETEAEVAMTLDMSDGNETFTILVKKLADGSEVQRIEGEISEEVILHSGHVFFLTLDDAHRPEKLYRQKVGTEEREELFHEPDEKFWVCSLDHTADEKYVVFQTSHKTRSEWHYLDVKNIATGKFNMFYPRTDLFEYDIDHHEDLFGAGKGGWLIWHNGDGATNFRVDCLSDEAAAAHGTADRSHWRPFLSYNPHVNIESVTCYKGFLLVSVRLDGFATVLKMDIAQAQQIASTGAAVNPNTLTNIRNCLSFDDEATRLLDTVQVRGSGDFESPTFRIEVTNLIVPDRLVEVDPSTLSTSIMKREVVRGYDKSLYRVERIMVTATKSRCDPNDPQTNLEIGKPAQIPVTICYRADRLQKGTNPCLLYAYGSYGVSIDPEFSSNRISLLDRGVVYALASIRGGGELGRIWRNSGRMEYKINTFTDFIDCGRHLVASGWCHPEKLTACGRSAGGMLMGAVTHMEPSLWRTVIAGVPFVDCLTTMLDPTIPLTVPEWDEWGNPLESEKYYRIIKEYSPMDHVDATEGTVYPNIFATSGLTDPRVAYWEPAAWVARLRKVWGASAAKGRFICHKCVIGAGHGGAAGRYKHLEEASAEYSFLLQSVGIKE